MMTCQVQFLRDFINSHKIQNPFPRYIRDHNTVRSDCFTISQPEAGSSIFMDTIYRYAKEVKHGLTFTTPQSHSKIISLQKVV